MVQSKSPGYYAFKCINAVIMTGLCLAIVLPFLNMLAISLSDSTAVVSGQVKFLPVGFSLESYKKIFSHPSFISGFLNSFFQTAAGCTIGLFMLVICAYPLSKTRLKGRKFFMLMILFTMFFSGGLIPTYMLVRQLNLIDTIWALVLPFCIIPYNLILIMTFFRSIPPSLEESACIDGLNPIQTLFQIVLPMSKPILATMFMFLFVYYWNNWFNSMIYLDSSTKFPIMLVVRNIMNGASIPGETSGVQSIAAASLKSASVIVTTLPILIIFPFTQKYFVQGMMLGSVKG